jgi:hypothetical protein
MQKKVSAVAAKRRTKEPITPAKRPTHPALPAIYALTDWTVKKANGKWYVAPTARFEDKPQWSKPYATLQRATTAIARKLADEVMRRHKRRCDYYGIDD